ncbi:DUF5665 domain-containing protein [Aneurinibacillus sp. Ricciae_BoGa-3]|uniref:DUF5665 domain-containing protein n=1 Tax=Aneurinibacillus sp. Ricciae_BoGa-3 TaxID=3022697 RepID=UPI0023416233|nr:DUF5665 domain-containing protein [Aneurinibacillus sp. Ricciae_BoGa-3]WCK55493.1 DUF5665 domain-containing protein [Aneurinibacillus sp. Ricciae_BoGa-3]
MPEKKVAEEMSPPYSPGNDPIEEKYEAQLRWLENKLKGTDMVDYVEGYQKPLRLMLNYVISGIGTGLSVTMGLAIVVAIVGYILSYFDTMPVIGKYIADLVNLVQGMVHHPHH